MSIVLQGSTSGSVTLQEPSVAGTTVIDLPATSGTMALLQTPSFATTIGVGGATPSASGAGITFPATQSASTDANTLDDYEEGTWTPGITNATSYTVQLARYTKIGNLVYAYCNVACSFNNTGSTNQLITGLPFTIESVSNDLYPLATMFQVAGWNQSPMLIAVQGGPNATTCTLYTISQSTGNNYTSIISSTFGSSVTFEMSIVYRAA
jgi:hypothetical protein